MTEEQGGEQVGRLWVEVGGDAKTLDDLLANVESRLRQFIKTEYQAKIGVSFEETGGAQSRPQGLIDRHGKTLGKAIGQSALGQLEATAINIKDVRVEAKPKIDKDTLIAGLQGALDGHRFKLSIDTDHLKAQIQAAMGGSFNLGSVAGGHAAPAQNVAGITQAFRETFDKRLDALTLSSSGKERVSLGDAIKVLSTEIRDVVGRAPSGTGATSALEDLVSDLGDDFSQWAEKTTALTGDSSLGDEIGALSKKLGSAGQLGQDFAAARSGRGQEVTAAATAFAAQVAKKIVRETPPSQTESPVEAAAERTLAEIKRSPFFTTTTTIKDIFGGLASNREPDPSFAAVLNAAIGRPRTSISAPGDVQTRQRGVQFGGRGLVKNQNVQTGIDTEADARADQQLGTDRANPRRLRGRLAGVEGIAFDLEGLARTLERGGLRNIIRETKTGQLREIEPRGGNAGELIESDLAIRELRKRAGSKRFSLEGIDSQVQFVKPQEVVEQIVKEVFGGDIGEKILSSPEVKRTISQATRQGAANKPFDFLGAAAGATRLGGTSPEAAAREGVRLQRLIKETDESIGRVGDQIERLSGSGKPTERLEGVQNRLGLRRQRLSGELEAITPNIDRPLSAEQRRLLAAASSAGRAASRANIEQSVGLSPIEKALKAEQSEDAIAQTIASKMRQGLLPAYETMVDRLSTAVESAVPRGEAGENQFSARFRAFSEESQSLASEFGLADQHGKNIPGRGEDRKLFNALLGEVKGSIFTERGIKSDEGDRAADLLHAGSGKGRVPKTTVGQRVDLTRTSTFGQAVQVAEFARPTTSLDTERQSISKKYDEEALRIAQRKFEESQVARADVPKEVREGFGSVEDFLRVPRVRKQATSGGRSDRSTAGGYRPDIIAELESSTDVGKRMAEIKRIQREADAALNAAGPAIPLESGRKRSVSGDRIARIKELGLEPAVENEAVEVLQQNARGQRTPYTKAGKEVPSGDQVKEAFAAAAEGRQRRYVGGIGGGTGGTGGGGSTGDGGGQGSSGGLSFPVPLPVLVVNDILRVSLEGGGGPRGAARGEGGVASAGDQAEAAASAPKQFKKLRYNPPRITVTPYQRTREQLAAEAADAPFVEASRQARIQERDNQRAARLANQNLRRPTAENRASRAAFVDIAEDDRSVIGASLRSANRLVPKRGFTASLTDLVTSKAGGTPFEKQLTALDRATREASDLATLGTQRAALRSEQRVLIRGGARPDDGTAAGLRLGEVRKELTHLAPVIRRSTDIFNKNISEVTKGTNVLRSFTAAAGGAAISAAVGSVTFGLGLAVTGPIIQAIGQGFTELAGSGLERALGYPQVAAQQQTALGQATRAAGGRADLAFAQSQLQTGLGTNQAAQIGSTLTKRAQIEAGNQAFRDQLDQFRAAQQFETQDRGRLGDAALSTNLTGFLGTSFGGTPSFSETLGDLFENIPQGFTGDAVPGDTAERADAEAKLAQAKQRQEAAGKRPGDFSFESQTVQVLEIKLAQLGQKVSGSSDALAFFTARAKDSGVDLKAVAGGTLTDVERQKQGRAFAEAGLTRQANQVLSGQVGFRNNAGQAFTDPQQLIDLFTKIATNTPKPSAEAILAAGAPALKAQLYTIEKQRDLGLQNNRFGEAFDVGAQPFQPATSGIDAKGAAKYKGELAGVQQIFDQITKEAAAARSEAVDFFRTAFPGNEQGAQQFQDALGKSAQYGQQIANIEIGVQTAQAALAAKQYSFQIAQVKRSLADALGLQGKITSGANNLGVIERQQFELQRQAQALSLGQSQRQINFQRAIAGLTAPGLTGEERAARIEQAKLEADYAQKQLDIQKKLFGLGGKQFQITADRNVIDLTRNLELLQAGREVTLKTAVAQKQIQALTALQARENKRIQTFYQSAIEATNSVLQLEAQLVAQTEIGLNKVGNLVLDQFRKVYTGLIKDLGGSTSSSGGGGGGGGGGGKYEYASGGLFNTSGATDITVGEAGNETVAVLRNPRSVTGSFGGGGGTTQIVIDLRGANVSGDEQMKRLTQNVQEAVERGLAKKGNLYGLR